MKTRFRTALAFAAIALSTLTHAQTWPAKPVKIGNVDALAVERDALGAQPGNGDEPRAGIDLQQQVFPLLGNHVCFLSMWNRCRADKPSSSSGLTRGSMPDS